jgi:16S rRNA (guanine966-N2)-methyltransferase
MRVIAGSARGRPLVAPKTSATRPTSDLLRGVIFNLLANEVDDLGLVLDLYAGSGALGIEALSRGAERADFVEAAPVACRAIKANLERLGFQDQARVYCQPVNRLLPKLVEPYTIVLLDPPYADPSLDAVLLQLESSPVLGPDTLVVLEHARNRTVGAGLSSLTAFKERRHGDGSVTLFRRGE